MVAEARRAEERLRGALGTQHVSTSLGGCANRRRTSNPQPSRPAPGPRLTVSSGPACRNSRPAAELHQLHQAAAVVLALCEAAEAAVGGDETEVLRALRAAEHGGLDAAAAARLRGLFDGSAPDGSTIQLEVRLIRRAP